MQTDDPLKQMSTTARAMPARTTEAKGTNLSAVSCAPGLNGMECKSTSKHVPGCCVWNIDESTNERDLLLIVQIIFKVNY